MLAVRKQSDAYGDVSLSEIPVPSIKDDEILMKVWAGGVCGSDLLIRENKHFFNAPVTLGHEFSGIAAQVGKNVKNIKEGDKIVGDIETSSGWLGVSRDGAFAEYMAIPEAQTFKVADSVSLDHACFTEPVVATIHSMQERNNVNAGDVVVIVGPGPMGILGAQFAKLRGAKTVAVIGLKKDEKRLQIAKASGADYILYSEEHPEKFIAEITHGRGADFVLEASASALGVQHAIDCARRSPEGRGGNGKISFISLWGEPITLRADAISLFQLDISGAWSWNGPETWERAVDLISMGAFNLDILLTNRYRLDQWETAFSELKNGNDVKAFIHPNGQNW